MTKTFAHLVESDVYTYDVQAAERVVKFVESFCTLSDPFGQPFHLLPWQRQLVGDVFGWRNRRTGERRFSSVFVEVPRKNGKTELVAALGLYLLIADGVEAAEVYCAALTRDQSGILYRAIRRMAEFHEWLRERVDAVPYKSEVRYGRTGSFLKALSGESVGSHGKRPSAVLLDELHEWIGPKAEDLYEALTSGFGNRRSPITIAITTAGHGGNATLARRMHDKAKSFESGQCGDPTFYGVTYGLDEGDDWTDIDTWRKANPSWDMAERNLLREFAAAKVEKSKENTFRRLYLNQWTAQVTRWLDMASWKACSKDLDLEDFTGRDVVLGVDLSQVYDLTAVALLFPDDDGKWTLFSRAYMPSAQVEKRTREDGVPYTSWVDDGLVVATEGISRGLTVDYATVAADILDLASKFNVLTVAYDPAGFHTVNPILEVAGLDTMPVWQSFKDMSPGSKELERRLTSGEVTIATNACLEWQAGNVEVAFKDGMIRPTKPSSGGSYKGSASARLKVDGIVAAVIAAQATLLTVGKPEPVEEKPHVSVFFVKR